MRLRTLGGPVLEGSSFRRAKPLLLLAYVALEGPCPRRALAELFWPEAADARDSLSTTLRRLRSVVGTSLVVDDDRIATTVRCDVTTFVEAVGRGEPDDVVHAYGGAFLDGLSLRLSGEVEEWIYETRERLAGAARRTCLAQVRRARAAGDRPTALRLAETAWTMPHAPPLDPQGLETVAWLLRVTGSPRLADAEREARLVGFALTRDGGSGASTEVSSGGVALSIPGTAFIGREREIAEIAAVFALPHGRLVTLHGPGGAGKSRLASEAVRRLLRDGVPFDAAIVVALEAVASPDLVGDAVVVAAMGLVATAGTSAERQVIRAIGARSVLLVLDNMEHLLEAKRFVSEVVRSCPAVRIVVTSRVALHLVDEHRIAVDGLPVEPDGSGDGAADLLMDRMRQVGSSGGRARTRSASLDSSPAVHWRSSWQPR